MIRSQLLQQMICLLIVALLMALVSSCGTVRGLLATPTPTPLPSKIVGDIANLGEHPRTRIVIPCLFVENDICQVQSDAITNVSDDGTFEITNISPGTYTFLYGPAIAENTRPLWEDKYITLINLETFAQSLDPDAELSTVCIHAYLGNEVLNGLRTLEVTHTFWVDVVSLQLDVPVNDIFEEEHPFAPLQIEVTAGDTVNVTLRGLGCEE